jgi:hypothetical protein
MTLKKLKMVEKYIEELGERFIGMYKNRFLTEEGEDLMCIRIEVNFHPINVYEEKKAWVVFGEPSDVDQDKQIIQVVKGDRDYVYQIFSVTSGVSFDDLFKHALSIIKYNEDIERKNKLLETKMNELGELFIHTPYEKLKNLKFYFSDNLNDIKNKIEKKKKNKKRVVNAIDNALPTNIIDNKISEE